MTWRIIGKHNRKRVTLNIETIGRIRDDVKNYSDTQSEESHNKYRDNRTNFKITLTFIGRQNSKTN